MVPRGLEPRTLRLLAVRSNQLSYETLTKKHVRVCLCTKHKHIRIALCKWAGSTNERGTPHIPEIGPCWSCHALSGTRQTKHCMTKKLKKACLDGLHYEIELRQTEIPYNF